MIAARLKGELSSPSPSSAPSKSNVVSSTDRPQHHSSQSIISTEEMSLCTGLSALIQAATTQLGHSTPDLEDLQRSSNSNTDIEGYESLQGNYPAQEENIEASSSAAAAEQQHSFPELLMTLLLDPDNIDIIAFLPDGSYFAIRTKEFSKGPMRQCFQIDSFEDFLTLMNRWGFTRVCGNTEQQASSTNIQVFRHPCFRRGEREGLRLMKDGQNPTEARMSAIPERFSRIELSLSEDSSGGPSSAKRRLSQSHIEGNTDDSTLKSQRVIVSSTLGTGGSFEKGVGRTFSSSSNDDSETSSTLAGGGGGHNNSSRAKSSSEIRSFAMAVTTAELDIQSGENEDTHNGTLNNNNNNNNSNNNNRANRNKEGKAASSLVEGGVERATHTIVTDAIETLLFDEGHTRETYLKHEQELSKSSLPGVVPISKQLFSPSDGVANTVSMATTTNTTTQDKKTSK